MVKSKKTIKIVVGVLLLVACLGGCTAQAQQPSAEDQKQQVAAESSMLSFAIAADDWDASTDESLIVKIEGTDADGKKVSEQYKAVPDTKYNTELNPGSYVIALASASPTKGTRLFKADATDIAFDGTSDAHGILDVRLDREAMDAAEAKRKAEEEAKRKAEEEAKRAAEAKAAAEAAAKSPAPSAPAGNSASSGAQNTSSVYIASSGKGKKYHSNPNCSRMKGTITLTVSEASSRGYTPCSKCY